MHLRTARAESGRNLPRKYSVVEKKNQIDHEERKQKKKVDDALCRQTGVNKRAADLLPKPHVKIDIAHP